jgi:hypothetical protein
MRTYFSEGDLISVRRRQPAPRRTHGARRAQAEVQNVLHDGAVSLHTRSLKYGKVVARAAKQSFSFVYHPLLTFSVRVAAGKRAVSACASGADQAPKAALPQPAVRRGRHPRHERIRLADAHAARARPTAARACAVVAFWRSYAARGPQELDADSHERVARVRNSVVVLWRANLPIFSASIMDVYNESLGLGLAAKAMLDPELLVRLTQPVQKRAAGAAPRGK